MQASIERAESAVSNASAPNGAQRIVRAAIDAFARRGYDGTSLRFIASAAEVDPALIVHHFGSKLGVWRAAVDHVAARLAVALERLTVAIPADGVAERRSLASALASLIDLVCESPVIAQFIVKELVQQNDRFDHVYERLVRPIHERVGPLFTKYVHDERRAANPDVQFFAFAGALATSVAARSYLAQMVPDAADDVFFRAQLKEAIVNQFLPKLEGFR
jgi:AcrR family transcriptional regulator